MDRSIVAIDFVDYCNLLEQAHAAGYTQVVLPAILALPDICGRAVYKEMSTEERYKKWIREYGPNVLEGLAKSLCNKCSKPKQCEQVCEEILNADTKFADKNSSILYAIKCDVTREGYFSTHDYLFSMPQAGLQYPLLLHHSISGRNLCGRMSLDISSIAKSLISSATEFYTVTDSSVKEELDRHFSHVYNENTMYPVF